MFLKRNLVTKLHEEGKVKTKREGEELVDSVFNHIEEAMKTEPVKINNFKWKQAKRAPRKGRNPQTGEEIEIPEKTVFKFKFVGA